MKKILITFGSAVLVIVSATVILDLKSPPDSNPESWHAYLTQEELNHPLATYWFKRQFPDQSVIDALEGGPLKPDQVLMWDQRHKLVNRRSEPAPNGWAVFPDGSAYVAVNTFFPGATADMLDWWFEWAQREEDIRYKIWYPGAHYAMLQAPTPNAPVYQNPKAYWGTSRFPVEDVGVGVSRLRLDFVAPSEFGFDELPEGSTMLAVRVGLPNGLLKTTDMIHYVSPVEGGVEMRSRFWIARDFEAMSGGAGLAALLADNVVVKRILMPENLPQELALHCANEYAQLASFLPQVYATYAAE